MTEYLKSTRHSFSALMLVLPLLMVYEGGVLVLGASQHAELRNGADAWIRNYLVAAGINFAWTLPLLLSGYLVGATAWEWKTRPKNQVSTFFGMIVESVLYAVVLWAIWRNFPAVMAQLGLPLNDIGFKPLPTQQVIRYIGAGIYEETLFRLALFGLLSVLLQLILIPKFIAVPFAAIVGAVAFSAAHHLGANGEVMRTPTFVFRTVAGLLFTALYVGRGFGVAVGAHAGYNVLVGVGVE